MADFSITINFTSIGPVNTLPIPDPVDISGAPFAPWRIQGTLSLPSSVTNPVLTGVSYSINNGPATDATPATGFSFQFDLLSTDIPCNGSYIVAVYAYASDGTGASADIGTGLETRTLRQSGIISPPPSTPPPGQIPPPPPPPGPPPVI